jgi:hypothetical protein
MDEHGWTSKSMTPPPRHRWVMQLIWNLVSTILPPLRTVIASTAADCGGRKIQKMERSLKMSALASAAIDRGARTRGAGTNKAAVGGNAAGPSETLFYRVLRLYGGNN